MDKEENKVLKSLVQGARQNVRVFDVFDLMYKTSLPYCELKDALGSLVSRKEVECVDERTYKFTGETDREIEDDGPQPDEPQAEAAEETEETEETDKTDKPKPFRRDYDYYFQMRRNMINRRKELLKFGMTEFGKKKEDDGNGSDDEENRMRDRLLSVLTDQSEKGKLLAAALKLCVSEGNISVEMLSSHLDVSECVAEELCFWLYLHDLIRQEANGGYKMTVPEEMFYNCCIEAREHKKSVGALAAALRRISEQKQREEEDNKLNNLILSDISLGRSEIIVKAQGCIMAAKDLGNNAYAAIYQNIADRLGGMSDDDFTCLKNKLKG